MSDLLHRTTLRSTSINKLLSFLLLATLFGSALAKYTTLLVESAEDHSIDEWLNNATTGDTLMTQYSTYVILDNIPDAPSSPSLPEAKNTNSSFIVTRKRNLPKYTYLETKIIWTVIMWSTWGKIGACSTCPDPSRPCSLNWKTRPTTSWSTQVGGPFNQLAGPSILKWINSHPALNQKFTWAFTKNQDIDHTCSVPGNLQASLWERVVIGQAKVSQRKCVGPRTGCSDWSSSFVQFPVVNTEHTIEVGCATGDYARC